MDKTEQFVDRLRYSEYALRMAATMVIARLYRTRDALAQWNGWRTDSFDNLHEAEAARDSRALFARFVKTYVLRVGKTIRGPCLAGASLLTRQQVLLAILAASNGRPYSPVQIQKAVFLVTENLPHLVGEGERFKFEPYDYGPFDQAVYADADQLEAAGLAEVIPQNGVRWSRYAASDRGVKNGEEYLKRMAPREREYIKTVATWVRSQPFESLVKSIYAQYPQMKVNSIFRG